MQKFETQELKQLIANRFDSIAEFCTAAGITDADKFARELEQSSMSAQDIKKAVDALEIQPEEITKYFFTPATDPNIEFSFKELLNDLTPENQKKVINKYFELLAEQEQAARSAKPCKV